MFSKRSFRRRCGSFASSASSDDRSRKKAIALHTARNDRLGLGSAIPANQPCQVTPFVAALISSAPGCPSPSITTSRHTASGMTSSPGPGLPHNLPHCSGQECPCFPAVVEMPTRSSRPSPGLCQRRACPSGTDEWPAPVRVPPASFEWHGSLHVGFQWKSEMTFFPIVLR